MILRLHFRHCSLWSVWPSRVADEEGPSRQSSLVVSNRLLKLGMVDSSLGGHFAREFWWRLMEILGLSYVCMGLEKYIWSMCFYRNPFHLKRNKLWKHFFFVRQIENDRELDSQFVAPFSRVCGNRYLLTDIRQREERDHEEETHSSGLK